MVVFLLVLAGSVGAEIEPSWNPMLRHGDNVETETETNTSGVLQVETERNTSGKCAFLHETFFSSNDTAKLILLNGAEADEYRGGDNKPFAATFTEGPLYCALTYCPGTRSLTHRESLPKTHVDASNLCANLGLRLCTEGELDAQLTRHGHGAICTGCGCRKGMTADMRRWTKTAGAPSCPQGQIAVGNGQCLEPIETLSQDTRCCADLPEVYVPGEQTHYGFGKFSISRFVYIGHGARGYQYTAETLNHHMALKALHDRGERLGEEHRLIGATSTDVTQHADGGYDNGGFNGSSITNDFSIEAVLSNITGVNNTAVYGHTPQSNPLPITRRRLRGAASLSTWLARAISTVKESCWQLWA